MAKANRKFERQGHVAGKCPLCDEIKEATDGKNDTSKHTTN